MVTGESRLRGALDLLVTDEPVLDLYANGLWAVPATLIDDVSARMAALVADSRSARLTAANSSGRPSPTPPVVAELLGIVAFLCGDAAVRAGSRLQIEYDLIERFRTPGMPTLDSTVRWIAPAAPWRPPGGPLFWAAGDDRGLREVALELTVESLRALDGIPAFEPRRQALLSLYDAARRDPALVEATLTTPQLRSEWIRLEERWAEVAGDELVAVLPELTGPVGYLSWIVDGWIAAHERLAGIVPVSGTMTAAFVSLLIQAGMKEAPAELAVGVRGELYAQVRAQLPVLARTWELEAWRRHLRDWLARALVAGELELCRVWLDLAVRLTGAVQGLPGTPVTPRQCLVPVGWFQEDVRRLFRVRRVRHPLTGTQSMPGWLAVEESFPFGSQLASRAAEDGATAEPSGAQQAAHNGTAEAAAQAEAAQAEVAQAEVAQAEAGAPAATDGGPIVPAARDDIAAWQGAPGLPRDQAFGSGKAQPLQPDAAAPASIAPTGAAAFTAPYRSPGAPTDHPPGPPADQPPGPPADQPPGAPTDRAPATASPETGRPTYRPADLPAAAAPVTSRPADLPPSGPADVPTAMPVAEALGTAASSVPRSVSSPADPSLPTGLALPASVRMPSGTPAPSARTPARSTSAAADGSAMGDAAVDTAAERAEATGTSRQGFGVGQAFASPDPYTVSPQPSPGMSLFDRAATYEPNGTAPSAGRWDPPAPPAQVPTERDWPGGEPAPRGDAGVFGGAERFGLPGNPPVVGRAGAADQPAAGAAAQPAAGSAVRPAAGAAARPANPAPSQRTEPPTLLEQALAMIDSIVGQPALVTALREILAAPEHDLRLLVAGPPGTGKSLTVDVLARLMTVRGFDGTAVWITHEEVAQHDAMSAVDLLRERASECDGSRLLVLDGLDLMVHDGHRGKAVADELHRLISVFDADLQIVAFGADAGYRRLVDASPALAAWWRVVRTRDFDAGDYATIFGRVVAQRGAYATEDAARRAGDMLAATPGEGQLRNARLATCLADMAVEAARRRTDGAAPTVDLPDLPQLEPDFTPVPHPTEGAPGGLFSRLGRMHLGS